MGRVGRMHGTFSCDVELLNRPFGCPSVYADAISLESDTAGLTSAMVALYAVVLGLLVYLVIEECFTDVGSCSATSF